MGNNLRKKIWTFQDNAGALGNGSELSVNVDMMTATLEITGSGTNKVIFEGKSSTDSTYYPIIGVNLSNYTMASEVTAKGVIYQISLEGLISFRVRISEYTSGNITVKGSVVN